MNAKDSVSLQLRFHLLHAFEGRGFQGTDRSIRLTMVTTEGIEHNEGWQSIQSEVLLDDLFEHEG